MAKVATLVGELMLIQIGDGASPETFAHPCLINAERGLQLSSDVNDFITPDCTTPTDPAFKEIFKDGLQAQVSGAGVINNPDTQIYYTWFLTDTAKNVRVNFNTTGALGGGYIAFPAKLTNLSFTGNRKTNSTVEITLQSHGTLAAWVANP